jgi:hypothetical protein
MRTGSPKSNMAWPIFSFQNDNSTVVTGHTGCDHVTPTWWFGLFRSWAGLAMAATTAIMAVRGGDRGQQQCGWRKAWKERDVASGGACHTLTDYGSERPFPKASLIWSNLIWSWERERAWSTSSCLFFGTALNLSCRRRFRNQRWRMELSPFINKSRIWEQQEW